MPATAISDRKYSFSRGYTAVLAGCAVTLIVLAAIQWMRGRPLEVPFKAIISSASSPAGYPLSDDLANRLQLRVMSDDALETAQAHLLTTANHVDVNDAGQLRKELSAKVDLTGQQGAQVVVSYISRQQFGRELVRLLAESAVDSTVTRPRIAATNRVNAAKAAVSTAQTDHLAAVGSVEELSLQMDALANRIAIAEQQASQVIASQHVADDQTPQSEEQERLGTARARLAQLQQQRSALLRNFTAEHPAVVAFQSRIAEATQQVNHAAKAASAAEKASFAVQDSHAGFKGEQRRNDLLAEAAALTGELNRLDQLRSRRQRRANELLAVLQQQQAALSEAEQELAGLDHLQLQIHSFPDTQQGHYALGRFDVLVAIGAAMLASCGTWWWTNTAQSRLMSAHQIESVLALPIVGLLPGTYDAEIAIETAPSPRTLVLRRTCEACLAVFLVATLLCVYLCEGYLDRLSQQSVSAISDSVRTLILSNLT